jgi:hypothetical protein
MRTRVVEYHGKKSLIVYLAEKEIKEYESFLPNWNEEYESVVTYFSGVRDMKTALKQIVSNHAS